MLEIREIPTPGYEKIIEAKDSQAHLHAFFAIHSTTLGPALGGVRFYPYEDPSLALEDVMRLSKAMSYKSALMQTGLGGGKSVIIGHPKTDKSQDLLLAFGEALNTLKGQYIIAEDVGTTLEDMSTIRTRSPYVAALPFESSSGDPSRFTSFGVYKGMQATAKALFGSSSLTGRKVLIQGLGNVGFKLAHFLFWEGASLIVCDHDSAKMQQALDQFKASSQGPKNLFEVECDFFAPCALGAILNKETIPKLRCLAVTGSANNQLLEAEDGKRLMDRNILWAPDYVINAGGIINAASEFDEGGYNPKSARDKTAKIYEILSEIYTLAKERNQPPGAVADELAEYNLIHGIGKRKTPLAFL